MFLSFTGLRLGVFKRFQKMSTISSNISHVLLPFYWLSSDIRIWPFGNVIPYECFILCISLLFVNLCFGRGIFYWHPVTHGCSSLGCEEYSACLTLHFSSEEPHFHLSPDSMSLLTRKHFPFTFISAFLPSFGLLCFVWDRVLRLPKMFFNELTVILLT